METPSSSSRRITRSQTLALASNNNIPISSRKNEESDKGVLKSRQRTNGGKQERERSALIDITNDSPIVGLAMGNLKTPSSTFSKNSMIIQNSQSKQDTTPGSGEDLLRGQVKTLLQKVEEEAVLSKIPFNLSPLIHKQGGFVNSPMSLLAPTPTNTPQVSANGSESLNVSPVAEKFNFEVLNEQEESGETEEKNVITRSLFTDFSEKFEGSDCENKSSNVHDDDDASVWSVQVNASTCDEYEDEEFPEDEVFEEDGEDFEGVDDENGDDGGVDELCEVMSKISVNCGVKFSGKHIRFVYNSDGELEGEKEEGFEESSPSSSGILRLKGLPMPKGKHLRFPEESC